MLVRNSEIQMQNKKSIIYTPPAPNAGFTLIELLVVIGIMGMITGIFLINFGRLQGPRNLRIASNQLVTDLRRIQSYTLSSRNVPIAGSPPASYYILKFDAGTGSNNKYVVQAIDDTKVFSPALETISLPKSIQITKLQIVLANGTIINNATCAQVAFALPFGRILMEYQTTIQPCNIANTIQNSADLSANKNLILNVELTDTSTIGSSPQVIQINGISQSIKAQ